MFDYHLHSHFSPDARMNMEEAIQSAILKGLTEICFTDHTDYDYNGDNRHFAFDYKEYFKEIKRLQEKYQDKISIKKGVEIGLQPHLLDICNRDVCENDFDFVLCSIHSVEKSDLYIGGMFQNKTQEEAYMCYFNELYYVISNYDNFNVLGHLDVIKRYGHYDAVLPLEIYKEITISILKKLIENNKGIEVNTSGIRYGLGDYHPSLDILKLYHALGGEIITLGSDAHKAIDVGFDFSNTLKTLDAMGFKYICTFNKREPVFHHIKKLI